MQYIIKRFFLQVYGMDSSDIEHVVEEGEDFQANVEYRSTTNEHPLTNHRYILIQWWK